MDKAKKIIKKLNEVSDDSRLSNKEVSYFQEKYINHEFNEIKKEAQLEIFDKFDKYSCVKNDKWYLDYKKKLE